MNDFFGFQAYPSGLVNRIDDGNGIILTSGEWASAIGAELEKPAEASIVINNNYQDATRTLNTSLELQFINGSSETHRVCAFIIENNINSPQMNNNPEVGPVPNIEDYTHKHMLRGSLNGAWGNPVTDTDIEAGVTYTLNLSDYQLDDTWKEDDCYVIAFIYNESTLEIIQAEEEPVTP